MISSRARSGSAARERERVCVCVYTMGKGRDKRKRAKDKKVSNSNDGSTAAQKETGAAKTARKTQANATKRENRALDKEDDIDAALAALEMEQLRHGDRGGESSGDTVVVEELPEGQAPVPARSGFSVATCDASAGPRHEHSFVIFGGERLETNDENKSEDGKVRMYADVHAFDTRKRRWRRIVLGNGSSPRPHPRSGHVSFFYRNALYVFGGEFTSPNQNKFKHFRDMWRLNNYGAIGTDDRSDGPCGWERIDFSGPCPSARSGHRMARIGTNSFALFGGYYDDNENVNYFNDLWILEMDDMKWRCVLPGACKSRKGVVDVGADSRLWPSPRSGCQVAACVVKGADGNPKPRLFVHGGYVKERDEPDKKKKAASGGGGGGSKAGTRYDDDDFGEEKGKTLDDTWYFDVASLEWNRVRRVGFGPNARAGATMITHTGTDKAILFGGVADTEAKHGQVLISEFFNELYSFDVTKMRWAPIAIGEQGPAAKSAASSKQATHSSSEKAAASPVSKSVAPTSAIDRAATKIQANWRGYRVRKAYRIYRLGGALSEMLYAPAQGVAPKKSGPKPLGRIHAGLAVIAGRLYVYGGVIEMGETEITLDDLWSLDLKKRNKWECINVPSIKGAYITQKLMTMHSCARTLSTSGFVFYFLHFVSCSMCTEGGDSHIVTAFHAHISSPMCRGDAATGWCGVRRR